MSISPTGAPRRCNRVGSAVPRLGELCRPFEIGVFVESFVDQFEDPLDLLLQVFVVRRRAT